MRRSHWGFTVATAVSCSLAAISFTGCSSTGLKMPSLAWGSKKAPDPAVASTASSTGLPAPPSSTATPNSAPSYAQGGSTGSAARSWNSTPVQPASTSGTAYASSPSSSAGTGYRTPAATPAPYQPDYGQANTNASANPTYAGSTYGQASAPATPASPTTYGAAASTYGQRPSKYLVNGAASPAYTGPVGAQAPTPSSSTPGSSYRSPSPSTYAGAAPGGTYGAPSAPSYSPNMAADTASTGSPASRYGTPAAPEGGSTYGQPAPAAPTEMASAAPYLPGSTNRATTYGTSEQIVTPRNDQVLPAGYAGDSSQPTTYPSTGYPSSGASRYGSDTYSPTQTATPTSPAYPSTYQR